MEAVSNAPQGDTSYLAQLETEHQRFKSRGAVNRRWYYLCQSFHVLLTTSVPIILLVDAAEASLIGAVVSSASAILLALPKLFKFRENWILNEQLAIDIAREKNLFLGRAGPYRKSENPYAAFVETVERIKKLEFTRWTTVNAEPDDATRSEDPVRRAA